MGNVGKACQALLEGYLSRHLRPEQKVTSRELQASASALGNWFVAKGRSLNFILLTVGSLRKLEKSKRTVKESLRGFQDQEETTFNFYSLLVDVMRE